MILVDTSVWIDHLRGEQNSATGKLVAAAAQQRLLVGDLILLEVLQGARDERHARLVEHALLRYQRVRLLDTTLASRAARHYRTLRQLGITIRKTADLVIGTFCIEHRHALLHSDRDFEPMEIHLGLTVV